MPRSKLRQVPLGYLPETARRLASVFHQYYARLYWGNVTVRLATDTQLIVQLNGRVDVARLARLQEMADCLVEVQPIAPGYYEIMMWADMPKSVVSDASDVDAPSDTQYLYHRPYSQHRARAVKVPSEGNGGEQQR